MKKISLLTITQKFLKTIAIITVSVILLVSCGKKSDEPTPNNTTSTTHTYTGVSNTNVTITIYIYSDGKAFYDLDRTQPVGTLYIRTGLTTFVEKTPSEIYNNELNPIFTSKTGSTPNSASEVESYQKQ